MVGASEKVGRRADAVRNIERIVEAAIEVLSVRPQATMADIARAAQVGRVTVYGHFGSRAELVDAVVDQLIDDGEKVLAEIDLSGDPRDSLESLIRGSWHLLNRSRSILIAAQDELSPERIRELHAGPAARIESLIERGRRDGVFRSDMPASWLVAVVHQVLHGAADEITHNRLTDENASDVIVKTVQSIFQAPDR